MEKIWYRGRAVRRVPHGLMESNYNTYYPDAMREWLKPEMEGDSFLKLTAHIRYDDYVEVSIPEFMEGIWKPPEEWKNA